ncbi:MAG: DNA-3-methyladenine glycosylase [Acidimicrobiia bacterium]
MSDTARPERLGRSFYARDVHQVAPDLLNKLFVSRGSGGELVARIVEVEAYGGSDDPASHAAGGMTARNATMFGAPGHLYVYFTYGMHYCVNVVTGARGTAQAVLLRAAVPLAGLDVMRLRRGAQHRDRELLRGPARLARAFGLDRTCDGLDLVRGRIGIFDDGVAPPHAPTRTRRIGISRAQANPWRCCVPDEIHVSGLRNLR